MVRSLYIMSYFEEMKKWYAAQGFEFSNWNDKPEQQAREDYGKRPGRDLFYVPRGAAEHMVDNLARYALTRQSIIPGEPFIYLGFNHSAIKALDGTRSHNMERKVPAGAGSGMRLPENVPAGCTQIKWYRMCTFSLSVFMLTNKGGIAEDLEELYEVRMQMKSEIPVDTGSVFILNWPSFMINTQHEVMQVSNPLLTKGNLWALKYDVTLTGPAIEFDDRQIGPARAVSVALYEMGGYGADNKEIETIRVEK
jgi:hypothetical protein